MNRTVTILKSHFTKPGGAEKYARLLADCFHEKGCSVRVLTTGPIPQTFPYEVISCDLKSKTSVGKILEFDTFCADQLKLMPSDIVFGNDRNTFQTHLRAGSGVHRSYLTHRKEFESPLLSLRHAINPLHRLLLHVEKKSFEHPQLQILFTNSHMVKEEILTEYDIQPSKVQVIHNGVEWSRWQESFDNWQNVKTKNHFEFLFLGSNFKRKGLEKLLAALKQLKEPDLHLSIVGTDKNQKKYEHMAKDLPVTFHGLQNDVRPFLQKADCLVIPSFYDPFANVTTEALAMGLFVVSSKTNGGSEILTSNTGCVIEDLNDSAAFASALEIALKHPKSASSAKKIRQSVQHLDFSTQLNAYIKTCLSPTS